MQQTKQLYLTNLEILNIANYWHNFSQNNQQHFPVKILFYLQKNMQQILNLQKEIQQYYQDIITKYQIQEINENEEIKIAPENVDIANQEINELLSLSQEITIYPIALEAFGDNITLTMEEMQMISPMIAENFENKEE